MTKLQWPAPERNKEPILDVLVRALPPSGTLLEIASGTGQHVEFFARRLPLWTFQPSDVDAENLVSIRAYVRDAALPNLREPLDLDVRSEQSFPEVDAVFNANMIHIAPWEAAEGLLRLVGRVLRGGGTFVLYGPFRVGGQHTAPSNAEFEKSLQAKDPRYGVRDLEAVVALAENAGLSLVEQIAMPANNLTLIFRKVQSDARA